MAPAGQSAPTRPKGLAAQKSVFRAPGSTGDAACSPRGPSGRTSPEAPTRLGAAGGALNDQVQGLRLAGPDTARSTSCFPSPAFPFLEIPKACTVFRREPQNPENWNPSPETCQRRCRTGAARASGTAHVLHAGGPVSRYTPSPPLPLLGSDTTPAVGNFLNLARTRPPVAYAFAPSLAEPRLDRC